jgi:hypothetical protein
VESTAKNISIRVIGLHPIEATDDEFDLARGIQWGDDLHGEALENANRAVREHFAGLYLIEIEAQPPDSHVDWNSITQPVAGVPSANWQVPWDERRIGSGRWAFFMHFVQFDQPLQTSNGPVRLPAPTPIPAHLRNIIYELPS